MTGLPESISRLDAARRSLRQCWEQTRPLWSDAIAHRFETYYWQPFDSEGAASQNELSRVADLIAKARKSVP